MRNLLTTTMLTAYAAGGDNGTEITTPVGRIVWGHPCKPRDKTDQQNNKILDANGQPVQEVAFGLAIPTAEFQQYVWSAMAAEIAKGYPNGAPGNFSYKMTQEHEIDRNGKPYGEREGYAGCVVLAIATTLQAPNVFKLENGGYRQMQPNEIKTGDFVRCGINFKVNVPTNRSHTPSIYVNPLAIEFIGYGTEISSGFQADPNALFGGQQVALPAGASATPVGGAAPAQMPGMGMGGGQPQQGMPGNAQAGMPIASPQGAPAQQMMPAQSPAAASAPNGMQQMPPPATGFAEGQPQQGMPGNAPQPAMQPQPGPGGMPQMPR